MRDLQLVVKVTLHYGSTTRSKIDGDWPALIILIFSDCCQFPLRTMFFAYEDRKQITRLIAETTDSVGKNRVEELVAEASQFNHKSDHLLCKSHVVEAFDHCNLDMLATVENQLKFCRKLTAINPTVRPFLFGSQTIAETGIHSIVNLISLDKSASSTNQVNLFDYILQRENKVKHIALYQKRRFTKLGFAAAFLLNSFKYLTMLINEARFSNQHTEIVRMFLDSEFFSTELSALSCFTHKVTLPFVYCFEIST